MDFTAMDARAYRGLNADQYEERKSLVLSLAENMPEDATIEQIDAVDAEVSIIGEEQARRNKLAETRNQKVVEVIGGAGKVVGQTEERKAPALLRADNSLGARTMRALKERGYSRDNGRFQLAGVDFRAASDPQSVAEIAADAPGYYGAELTAVDPTIREGYRRELTIWNLFNHEMTDKDTVKWFTEGTMEGTAAMTAELGAFSRVHVNEPTEHTESLKKVTSIWTQSDEILTDAPRFVSHVNNRAEYNLDTVVEDQLVAGDGSGNNITGITNASGILTATATAYDMDFIESLLDKRTLVRKATPNFNVDTLLVADEDYDTLLKIKNSAGQYLLGGPVGFVYGQGVTIGRSLWNTITIVPTPALASGTSILGAFKAGATVYEHVSGRKFDVGYDGEDFSHGRVSFRAYQRFCLAVEYPAAFVKYTVG